MSSFWKLSTLTVSSDVGKVPVVDVVVVVDDLVSVVVDVDLDVDGPARI